MSLDLPALIDSWGYLAVLVGSFLEGETILALAGLAAFRGHMDFVTVVAIAMAAGFAGDQFFFHLGRRHGARILERFPGARAKADAFDAMLARWHAPLIVCVRFMYGFRILGPILLGMGRVSSRKFFVFNFIGAAIWAPLVAGAGYAFGAAIETLLHDLRNAELWGFGALVALMVLVGLAHLLRARARGRDAGRRRLP